MVNGTSSGNGSRLSVAAFVVTFPEKELQHLQVSRLSGQSQRRESEAAARVGRSPGLQQQAGHLRAAQPRGLVQGPPVVVARLVDRRAPAEQ